MSHHSVNQFVQNFDTDNIVNEIFSKDGHISLYKILDDFAKWEGNLDGKLYVFGCASMSTSHFASENLTKMNSIKNIIKTSVEYRLQEEIENHFEIANELEIELLNAKNCEKLAILANNITMTNERRIAADLYINQMIEIAKAFPKSKFLEKLEKLRNQFDTIKSTVENVFQFLQNPNKKTIDELKEKFNKTEMESKQLENELFEKLSENSIGNIEEISRKNLEYFYNRFHKISIENETSSNIIAGLYALNHTPPFLPSVGQVYEWYRHCHRLWNLAHATHGKIIFLKNLKINQKQKLIDTEKQFKQIIDEMNESIQERSYYKNTGSSLKSPTFLYFVMTLKGPKSS